MSAVDYRGYQYDSLSQVILSLIDHLDSEVDFWILMNRIGDYPLVNEPKVRRRLRLLEESNVVDVRESPRQNIKDKKYYKLNQNGRDLIDHHDLDLPVSLKNRRDIDYLKEHAEAAESYIRYLVDDLYDEQI